LSANVELALELVTELIAGLGVELAVELAVELGAVFGLQPDKKMASALSTSHLTCLINIRD